MFKNPAKIPELLNKVQDCIEKGEYLDTVHASIRQGERAITRPEILYVLKNGWHEKSKDEYQQRYEAWNYAIREKTIDKRELRVVVSFDENGMLIITAIDLDV